MLTYKDFFVDSLDCSIPQLAEAKNAFLNGNIENAEHLFADYVRNNLNYEKFFEIPAAKRNLSNDREGSIAAADKVCRFELGACGFKHNYEPFNIDWSLNPTPNNYGEYVWQFSRFDMVERLANGYRFEQKPIYGKVFAYLMESWIDQQPFPVVQADQRAGSYELVGWRTIESGIRMEMPWPFAIHIMIKDPAISDKLVVKIFMSIWEHGFHLEHYYSSHNWLVIEMMGLYMMATVFPFFIKAKRWRDFAFNLLYTQLDEQIYPEGFQYELATGYHLGVAHDYLRVVEIAQTYNMPVPEKMMNRIHDMFTVIMKLMQPDNRVPDLSDGTNEVYTGDMRYALKFFPDDENFKYFVSNHEEGVKPAYNSVSLETVGIGVIRTGWELNDIWALLESAHYGWGHQHEDKLSFDLVAYGKHMLEDGGQYEYDSSKMRDMIISTRAHNTALVDTYGQAHSQNYSRKNEERYVREKIPSDLFWSYNKEDYEVFEGSYKFGYGYNANIKVDHHRKVIFFKNGLNGSLPFFTIIDRFNPQDENEHLYEVLFQLGTEPIDVNDKTITANHGDGISMSLIGSVNPNILIGQYEPRYMGWKKDRSRPGQDIEHFKAPAILYTDKAKKDHIVTVVYPNKEDKAMPISAVIASDAYADKREFTIVMNDGKSFTFNEDDEAFATFDRDGNRCKE